MLILKSGWKTRTGRRNERNRRNGVGVYGYADTSGDPFEIWSTHKYLSACHVALTERGFDYPDQQCFCVDVRNLMQGDK